MQKLEHYFLDRTESLVAEPFSNHDSLQYFINCSWFYNLLQPIVYNPIGAQPSFWSIPYIQWQHFTYWIDVSCSTTFPLPAALQKGDAFLAIHKCYLSFATLQSRGKLCFKFFWVAIPTTPKIHRRILQYFSPYQTNSIFQHSPLAWHKQPHYISRL